MFSRKMVLVECIIKSRDKQIFQALLRIEKSFISIDFGLAKHVLVSPPTHSCTSWDNFDWSENYEITIYYVFIATMYSYWFDSAKTQHPAAHLNIHNLRIPNIKNVFLSVFSS